MTKKPAVIQYRDGSQETLDVYYVNTTGCLEFVLEMAAEDGRHRSVFIPFDFVKEVRFGQ